MTSSRIVIFAGGLVPDLEKVRHLVQPDDRVVCADGGTRHALALGLKPGIVVGDLDSLAETDRAMLMSQHAELRQHPRDKDETDLELALRYARQQKPSSILIVGALGNRLDQTIGNLSLLTDSSLASFDCRLDDGSEEAFFCRSDAELRGSRGDLVSLAPWGGSVLGIRTEGLRWALAGETLFPDKTRGISNEMLGDSAHVRIESGLLLIIHRRQS